MMLAARGVPARLVTGSFGGEEGAVLEVDHRARAESPCLGRGGPRAEAGFEVLDPTPPSGVPPAMRTYSLFARLASLGREIEFFYDRHVLGFDSGDQIGAIEAARESFGAAASSLTAFGRSAREMLSPSNAAGLLVVALAGWLLARLLPTPAGRQNAGDPGLSRSAGPPRDRRGSVSDATPPAEVARLLAEEVPEGRDDAAAVVSIYCASAFGGVEAGPEKRRELVERVKRLRKLA